MIRVIFTAFRIAFSSLSFCLWVALPPSSCFLLRIWGSNSPALVVVYIRLESICTSRCYPQVLAPEGWKRWKCIGSSQPLKWWQLKALWQQSGLVLFWGITKSLLTTTYYPSQLNITVKQPSGVCSPYCHWKTMLQQLLIYMSIKGIHILLASRAVTKGRSHVH